LRTGIVKGSILLICQPFTRMHTTLENPICLFVIFVHRDGASMGVVVPCCYNLPSSWALHSWNSPDAHNTDGPKEFKHYI